ncbi:MAG TPA: type IV secretion system protein [Allosphingosinicella sp.]|jgi:type IV secretion system protein VirB6
MEMCAPLPPGAGFLQSILAFLDCQALMLGASGYQALSAPGSAMGLVLGVLLTLFIALFGYRLLLGHGPDLRTVVVAFLKIGIVLALAQSWPAYRTLVYDVAMRGPAELAAEIGAPTALPGAGGGLVARLDGADAAFVALAILGEGTPAVGVDANQAPVVRPDVTPQPYPGFNTFAIAASRMVFLIASIAGLGAVRLIAGLLLAVGPLFVAFLLFDNTRSLFEGWVRVLGGAALAALGTSIALGAELALLEPWLTDILARRSAQEWLPGMPVELLVVTTVFALIVLALLYASARIAYAFRLAPLWQAVTASAGDRMRGEERARAAAQRAADAPAADRTRAASVVDAVSATQRREASQVALAASSRDGRAAAGTSGGGDMAGARRASPAGAPGNAPQPLAPAPLGQSFRRTRGRVSASAGRRDRRS